MHTFPLVSIPIFDILIFVLLFYPQLYFRVSYYRVINQKQSFAFLFCFTREKEVGTMPRSNDSETFLVFSFRQKYTTQNWKCCNSFPFILYWAESERGFYQRKNIKIAWKSWKRRKTVAVWQKNERTGNDEEEKHIDPPEGLKNRLKIVPPNTQLLNMLRKQQTSSKKRCENITNDASSTHPNISHSFDLKISL